MKARDAKTTGPKAYKAMVAGSPKEKACLCYFPASRLFDFRRYELRSEAKRRDGIGESI